MMNPMAIMKIKGMLEKFRSNHPKIPAFFAAASHTMSEGSIIEITVTNVDGKALCTNMRVTAEDIELINQLKELVAKG